ncbi:MAG: YbaK/EbsC family protein [Candidatus Limnocylindrales bacterium]
MTDISHPAIQRLVDIASRKGVTLDIRLMPDSTPTVEAAAAAVDADLGQIVKSLVFVADRPHGRLAPVVCLVSGRNQVDTALVAAVAGEVSVRAATAQETRDLTGYSIGEVPPFGHGRDVQVLMDRGLCDRQWVWAAAGTQAALFRVGPRTLRMLSNAVVAPLAEVPWIHAAGQFAPRLLLETGAGA